jgi:hypothetical protein
MSCQMRLFLLMSETFSVSDWLFIHLIPLSPWICMCLNSSTFW